MKSAFRDGFLKAQPPRTQMELQVCHALAHYPPRPTGGTTQKKK